jgi:hypothetical protein
LASVNVNSFPATSNPGRKAVPEVLALEDLRKVGRPQVAPLLEVRLPVAHRRVAGK